jgi:hypothetical protein
MTPILPLFHVNKFKCGASRLINRVNKTPPIRLPRITNPQTRSNSQIVRCPLSNGMVKTDVCRKSADFLKRQEQILWDRLLKKV